MKIIKKEQEKSEDAEIQKNDSVQGKDVQAEKTPRGPETSKQTPAGSSADSNEKYQAKRAKKFRKHRTVR